MTTAAAIVATVIGIIGEIAAITLIIILIGEVAGWWDLL